MAVKLSVYPAFYRRVRHYRDRIAVHDERPQVAAKFVKAAEELVLGLLQIQPAVTWLVLNPQGWPTYSASQCPALVYLPSSTGGMGRG